MRSGSRRICRPGRAQQQRAICPRPRRARANEVWESACKPGSVECSHSSGTAVAGSLKQPTRIRCGPHQRIPIWSCSGWSLPCRRLLPAARCALTAPFHPYRRQREPALRRSTLCCTGRRLAPPRRYLAPCPAEPGLSSPAPAAGGTTGAAARPTPRRRTLAAITSEHKPRRCARTHGDDQQAGGGGTALKRRHPRATATSRTIASS